MQRAHHAYFVRYAAALAHVAARIGLHILAAGKLQASAGFIPGDFCAAAYFAAGDALPAMRGGHADLGRAGRWFAGAKRFKLLRANVFVTGDIFTRTVLVTRHLDATAYFGTRDALTATGGAATYFGGGRGRCRSAQFSVLLRADIFGAGNRTATARFNAGDFAAALNLRTGH